MSVSENELAQAYDARFSEGGLRDSDAFYRWVLGVLDLPAERSLLDVACGEGHLLRFAEQWGLECHGVDISPEAIRVAGQVLKRTKLLVANGEELPLPSECFDAVISLGSLEHYLSPARGAREIWRVMKPDGVAAIVLPNSYYLVDIIWQVWRTGYGPDHHQVVQRFATVKEWQHFLEGQGLQVLRTHKYNFKFPRSRSDLQWYRDNPRKILNLLVAPFMPHNLSYHHLFICRKGEPDASAFAYLPHQLRI